jgi:GNAT superfamily N-acetyltransferase
MGELLIRRAGVEDARTIAEIHVAAWRESYTGVIPAMLLAALDVEERTARWRDILIAVGQGADDAVFLAQRVGEAPGGFASCGRQRSEKLTRAGYVADFSAIYVLRSLQRRGAGRRLMGAMAASLRERGYGNAAVWVLRDNMEARRFYEALGGETTGVEGVWSVEGLDIPDLAYGWRDISVLCQ